MLKRMLRGMILGPSMERYVSWLARDNSSNLQKLKNVFVESKLQSKFSSKVSYKAQLGSGIKFKHPTGIVIGDGVVIGDSVIIYQNVTLGARRVGEGKQSLYPKIGNDVVIYSGAVILGDVVIEDGATIGANAVVLDDVAKNSVVVGVPARIVGEKT